MVANGMRGKIKGVRKEVIGKKKKVFIMPNGKKLVKDSYGSGLTELLLSYIGKQFDTNVIGFYILKRVRKYDLKDIQATLGRVVKRIISK